MFEFIKFPVLLQISIYYSRGIVIKANQYILAHGLNLQPMAMKDLAMELGLPLAQCSFIRIPGHTAHESFRHVTAQQWMDSFYEQYINFSEDKENIICIGYSLGGLLMTHLLGLSEVRSPQKQILLAPALAYKLWSYLPAYFPAAFNNLVIPAFTPKKYKVHRGVTIRGYKALFEIREELEHLDPKKYNIPTLLICDQHDELVAPQGLQHFIEEKKLTHWELQIFKSNPWKHLGRKHLIVAKEFRSEAYWKRLKTCIHTFLHE